MTDRLDSDTYRSVWTDMIRTPFTYGWVEVDGARTRYLRAGPMDAPALVMLHGTSGSLETFSGNLEAHAARFQCFAFDMVGSGFSDKPDRDLEIADYVRHTAAFMDALEIERASFIGVSLGAWIASQFALDHPHRTERLVLLSTAGLLQNRQTQTNALTQRSRAVDDPSFANVMEVMSKLIRDPTRITDDMVAVRQLTYRLPEAKQAMAHVMVLQRPEVRERNNITPADWRRIDAPSLVIASVDDKNVWLETAYQLEKLMPNVRLVEMEGVNHWPHFESPAEFNGLSVDFLTSPSPTPAKTVTADAVHA